MKLFMTEAEAEKVQTLLTEVYGALWIEAYYDPTNDSFLDFARPLADKMNEVNKILEFKK